jgi:hypothetical protein
LPLCRRQKVGAQDFGPNRVGFRFLEILTLVVAVGGHRKAETYNQCEQRQGSREDDAQMLIPLVADAWVSLRNLAPAAEASDSDTEAATNTSTG